MYRRKPQIPLTIQYWAKLEYHEYHTSEYPVQVLHRFTSTHVSDAIITLYWIIIIIYGRWWSITIQKWWIHLNFFTSAHKDIHFIIFQLSQFFHLSFKFQYHCFHSSQIGWEQGPSHFFSSYNSTNSSIHFLPYWILNISFDEMFFLRKNCWFDLCFVDNVYVRCFLT